MFEKGLFGIISYRAGLIKVKLGWKKKVILLAEIFFLGEQNLLFTSPISFFIFSLSRLIRNNLFAELLHLNRC